MSLAVDVAAAGCVLTDSLVSAGSSAPDSGAAIRFSCDAPSPETGALTMSSHGAKSIGESSAGAAGASASA